MEHHKQHQQEKKNELSMIDRYYIRCSLREGSHHHDDTVPTISEACRDDVPTEFVCPITMEAMIDPTISIYGHTYEREAILRWIDLTSSCPYTRRPLHRTDVTPDEALAEKMEQWLWHNGLPNLPKIHQIRKSKMNDLVTQSSVVLVAPAPKQRHEQHQELLVEQQPLSPLEMMMMVP